MKILKKKFGDVYLLKPKLNLDQRGFFSEIYNKNDLNKALKKKINLIQLNHAKSKNIVLRGLHFQKGIYSQGKLIKVLKGKIFDVVVNINPKSKYFKKWASFIISEKNNNVLWVPRGYAHGYLTLEKNTEVQYLCDNIYKKSNEGCLLWTDREINIKWPKIKNFEISKKDKNGDIVSFFADLNKEKNSKLLSLY